MKIDRFSDLGLFIKKAFYILYIRSVLKTAGSTVSFEEMSESLQNTLLCICIKYLKTPTAA